MSTYAEFAALLDRYPRRNRRKLARNTYAERGGSRVITIRLHSTNILTFYPDGRVGYDSGGWQTATTRDRMKRYGPLNIWSYRGEWFTGPWPISRLTRIFRSGMVWHAATGTITGGGDAMEWLARRKREDRQRSRISSIISRWRAKARGYRIDRTDCAGVRWKGMDWVPCCLPPPVFGRKYWPSEPLTPGRYSCGCRLIPVTPKRGTLTLAAVLEEPDREVREWKARVYAWTQYQGMLRLMASESDKQRFSMYEFISEHREQFESLEKGANGQ